MNPDNILTKFVNNLKSKGRSPSTIIAYKKDLEQLATFIENDKKTLVSADTDDLENFVKSLMVNENYSLKTVSRKINSIKTFYKFLYNHNYISENYADPIEHPDFETKKPKVLSAIEYMALRDTVRSNPRLYTMVELMLQTGIRIGEISRLTVEDIEMGGKENYMFIRPYASNPNRTVVLNEVASRAISEWLQLRPEIKSEVNYLFSTKTGNALLVRNIRTSINNAFKKVGIEDVTVNDLRNTFIVNQLKNGVKVEKIAEVVGHQRISSTEKYLELVEKLPKKKTSKLVCL